MRSRKPGVGSDWQLGGWHLLCGSTGQTDYYELFSPSSGTWTLGTVGTGLDPANSPASALLQ